MNQADVDKNDLLLEKELLAPYEHIRQHLGKQVRIKIFKSLNHWLQVPEDILKKVIDITNTIHTSTLLIDDIQDDTVMRRAVPAAHRVYGIPLTINTSYHMIMLAMLRTFPLDNRAPELLMTSFLNGLRGQGMEIYWRDNFICPTEEQYRIMVQHKMGALFSGTCRMMQLFSENKTDYTKLLFLIGRYFQIKDDYCNLVSTEAQEEWPKKEEAEWSQDDSFCEDVTEGKFSFPVIHALKQPQGDKIFNILKLRTRDMSLKRYFVSLLDRLGSLQYTRDVLKRLDEEVRAEISLHGGNPLLEATVDELSSGWRTNHL